MSSVKQLHEHHRVPIKQACEALAVPRASFYRRTSEKTPCVQARPTPPRALTKEEQETILDVLNSKRFHDKTPRQVYAELLDEERYIGHWRTMYRILTLYALVRERRQAVASRYATPHLEATAPCQVWSWDITKLRGPTGVWYHLYVIIDIFSRYVVGWTLARRECKQLAADLIEETCRKQNIQPEQLVLHADRGPSMRSGTVSELLGRLGIEQSHSRPRVSDDNPFSEAQFKTVKYASDFPERFVSDDHVWDYCTALFDWYNNEHRHSGIALLTPATVHYNRVDEVLARRDATLATAYAAHADRFVNGPPRAARPPVLVRIGRQPSNPVTEPPPEAPLPVAHSQHGASLAGPVHGVPSGTSETHHGPDRERCDDGCRDGHQVPAP